MPDWIPPIIDGLTGEYGVIFIMGVVIFFLWKLFREKEKHVEKAWDHAREASSISKELAIEVRAWREASK